MARKWTVGEDKFLEDIMRKRVWKGVNHDDIVRSFRRRFPRLSADRTDGAIKRRIPTMDSVVEPEDYFA